MSYFSIDIEADGPIPNDYSMIAIGAVVVEPSLSKTFHATLKPISNIYIPDALKVSGYTREETLKFEEPIYVMKRFSNWINESTTGKPIFISDNNGFDWMFTCWYLHRFAGNNPFGWSSRRIGDLWCGLNNNMYARWKYLRATKHTHNPLDDAIGNAEALLKMKNKYGLKINLK